MAVIAECYVRGVSTGRVDGLVKTLGIEGISRSQVSRMAKTLDEEVVAFRSRPLDGGAPIPVGRRTRDPGARGRPGGQGRVRRGSRTQPVRSRSRRMPTTP